MKLSDLTLIQWLGIVLVINGAISGGVNEMTDLLGAIWAKHLVSIATIGSGVCGGLITMFGGIGTQARNVVAAGGQVNVSPQAATALTVLAADRSEPAIKAIVNVVLIAFAVSLLLAGAPAMAQQVRAPRLTGDVAKDFNLKPVSPSGTTQGATATDDALSSFGQQVRKITKELVDKAITDVQAASDDAAKHNDTISKPCWDANLALLKGLPSQWENPPTDIGIALGIQIQRDLLNSITGNDAGSLKVACAALWGDQIKIVANVGAMLGVKIATGGLFP